MYRNNFLACILALACITILIPSVACAQNDKVEASMAALKAETAKLGVPELKGGKRGGELYFGETKVSSNELVDAVVKKHGGVATLFVKRLNSEGSCPCEFVRVATTENKEDGTSAVGTVEDPNSPVFGKLLSGPPQRKDATFFGKTYDAGFEWIIARATNMPIGVYFVGQPK